MPKITEIKEKLPQPTNTLPDGNYCGLWGGYLIEVKYNNKTYELTTEQGVRGMNIKVIVNVQSGIATFEKVNN